MRVIRGCISLIVVCLQFLGHEKTVNLDAGKLQAFKFEGEIPVTMEYGQFV